MLIQNISGTASAVGLTSDSGPAPVATPTTQISLPQAAAKAAVAAQPTAAQVKSAVDNINSAMHQSNTNVEFSIDQGSKQTVIKVMDSQTGQTITQFPSKEALAVSQMIEQSQHGALVKQVA